MKRKEFSIVLHQYYYFEKCSLYSCKSIIDFPGYLHYVNRMYRYIESVVLSDLYKGKEWWY